MMSKLKKIFRDALAQRSPDERQAADDLERLQARIHARTHAAEGLLRGRRTRLVRLAPALAVAAAAALALAVLGGQDFPKGNTQAPSAAAPRQAATDADRAIVIYVQRAGDPEQAALSLTLNVRGDL
jgi:hypothetical protein